MLSKFSVTNFKNYKEKMTLNLESPNKYEFNESIVKSNILTKGIILGQNASGKSNLGLALFDIILNLTDTEKLLPCYNLYKNLESQKETVDFEYKFNFDGITVEYIYSKVDVMTLAHEKLIIDDKEVLDFDFTTNKGYTTLKGAESFKLSVDADIVKILNTKINISKIKYLKGNTNSFENNIINQTFIKFVNFVDRMLMFYSLDSRGYQGLVLGTESLTEGIIRANKLQEFQEFLASHGIHYDLVVGRNSLGVEDIYCKFAKGATPLFTIASTGTKSLAVLYYWYIKMEQASFVYIDEFDAFYHYEVAQSLIEKFKELTNTQIFVSTHNTDLITNELLRPDAYFIIKDNKIKSINESIDKDLRKAHNIQKMYKAGSFDE